MESSHSLAVSSPCGTLQTFSSIFDLGPLRTKFTPQNLQLHKIIYHGVSGMAD